ncbi:MAG TPA: LuxR C-terminal-related transcriptional regulator [Ktedonobacteraceae bacterium]|nr:LuxR C-terminal-related transcriptional regulator [Ktedonobacteraceae bacterium]
MDSSAFLHHQLLATKLFKPAQSHASIPRPHLTDVLCKSIQYKLTLVSAPAGFGKTTLLANWIQSHAQGCPGDLFVAWVSLDEGDNDPIQFWTYFLTALDQLQPGLCAPLLKMLQTSSLQYMLQMLINIFIERSEQCLLVLDDFHLVTNQEVLSTLTYLVEHLPPQLHIVLSTRTEPSLPITRWRARGHVLEIRADQLRCTSEEVSAFLHDLMHISLPGDVIEEITARTEGWMVGLQLLGLSLQRGGEPVANLLDEVNSGSQHYILDYLTDEVLKQQPEDVQTFLLSTSILHRLNASLCNAVLLQQDSQQMLEQLERSNLFVVSLDSQRIWYRYHTLFAEALRYQLAWHHSDIVPILHYRASVWYAEHNFLTEAISHAFHAHEWQWAADLIEQVPSSLTYGAEEQKLLTLQHWVERLPPDVISTRPRLCLVCAQVMRTTAPQRTLLNWLDAAERTQRALLVDLKDVDDRAASKNPSKKLPQQENLLGEILALRALLLSYQDDGREALTLGQQALEILSPQNLLVQAQVAFAQCLACYVSSINDAEEAVHYGRLAGQLALDADNPAFASVYFGASTRYLLEGGQLYEAQRLAQQAIDAAMEADARKMPVLSWALTAQASLLWEWNQLDAARDLALRAISLGKQATPFNPLIIEYGVLLHIYLSLGELDAARGILQKLDAIGRAFNPYLFQHWYSLYATVDRIRLWLADGELDRAIYWAEELKRVPPPGSPLTHEREEVASIRILLAQQQAEQALERLDAVLQRASAGKRWNHVLEIKLLQVSAYGIASQEQKALRLLAEVVQRSEAEGYIRRFLDEGPQMAAMLNKLRTQQRKLGPTPYLDTLLAAFQPEQGLPTPPSQQILESLSVRELEVLRLLVQGASNEEIAQRLVVVLDTAKRHVYHIYQKLDVKNRVQAVERAHALGLTFDEP